MEVQESQDSPVEALHVAGLGLLTSPGISLPLPGVSLRSSLGLQFGPNAIDRRRRSPDASGEDLAASLLLDHESLPSGLQPTGQGGIAGR